MLRPLDVLESVAQIIFDLSEARGVSLYLPAEDGLARPLLVHHGAGAPVPELADEAAAEALHRRAASGSLNGSHSSLVRIASRDPEGLLIGIGAGGRTAAGAALPALGWPADLPLLWVGLRDSGGALFHRAGGEAEARVLGSLAGLAYCGQLASAALSDPATRLQGRTAFRSTLDRLVRTALRRRAPLSLALLNPRGFGAVNERMGRDAGDAVLCEIGDRLTAALAGRGLAFRYGAAMFAVVVPGQPAAAAAEIAGELVARLEQQVYLDGPDARGGVRLDFACGVYALPPSIGEPSAADATLDLVRGADAALVLSGGHDVGVRTDPPPDAGPGARDRLSGIFTAEDGRDYRNMLLLWDSVSILASSGDVEALGRRLVAKLCATFDLDRVGLYLGGDGRPLSRVASEACGGEPGPAEPVGGAPAPAALEPIARANRTRRLAIAENAAEAPGGASSIRCAVPLVSGDGCRGFLLLESAPGRLRIDASERILLEALGGQLGVALDRIDRQRRERRRQVQERETLQSELSELRRALHHSKLAYCSPRMEALIEVARRVAPTEATVLILGESGSGKELVARTVHRLSRRGERPPVVVDCGAIAATLIDRELFGHERGAYTGAERGAPGRLAAAGGSTIILDEIGELPLEVQSKLLRFVQEKQVTPVGGTSSKTIDARVIAITHRDLAAEVAAGRFREDLYHRLNVVRLEVPPLRERPEDVDFLARIFLERFVVQYQKDVRELDPGAERALREHTWPGNVRELQNRVTQAVILCTGRRITAADLGLPADGYRLPQSAHARVPPPGPDLRAGSAPGAVPVTPPAPAAPAGGWTGAGDGWCALGRALHAQVAAAEPAAGRLFPLGRWLADDLVLAAHEVTSGVFCRAAARLGLPESTFRRRYHKASAKRTSGLASRATGWERVRDHLGALLQEDPPSGDNVLRRARHVLLAEVHERFPLETAAGAALMGVTEVTYRRWVARAFR